MSSPRRRRRSFLLSLLCLLVLAPGFAHATRYLGMDRFGVAEGLPPEEIVSVVTDAQGYLWVATISSVHRFDGRAFDHFDAGSGLATDRVNCLLVDRQGRLRVGTRDGVFLWDGMGFIADPLVTPLGKVDATDILEARDGAFWIGTRAGAARILGGEITRLTPASGLTNEQVLCLTEGRGGEIWIGTARGLNRWRGGSLDRWTTADGCQESSWLVAEGCLGRDYITQLRVDGQGRLWIATDWGVWSLDGELFRKLDLGVGDRRLQVLDLALDARGRLRMATLGAGVLAWDGRTLGRLGPDEGLPTADVWSLAAHGAGGMWIGTAGQGLVFRDEGPFHWAVASGRFRFSSVQDLLRTSDGDTWVATWGSGVVRLEGSRPSTVLTEAEGVPSSYASRLVPAARGGFWVGTSAGPVRWNGQRVERSSAATLVYPVRDLIEGDDGTLFVANVEEGLVRFVGGRPIPFATTSEPMPGPLWSMARDKNGRLWLGSAGMMFRWDGKSFDPIPLGGRSSRDPVLGIVVDAEERLWYRTYHGIGILDPRREGVAPPLLEAPRPAWIVPAPGGGMMAGCTDGVRLLRARADGPIEQVALLGQGDSTLRETFLTGGRPVVEADGAVLFGTVDGILRFDPSRVRRETVLPRVHLRRVHVLDRPGTALDPTRALELAHDESSLVVEYDGIAFPSPGSVEFRHRLDGTEREWSPPTTERSATFRRLPPGRYAFVLQARHGGSPWGSEVRSGVFRIHPPYWRTWWFLLIAGAALITGGVGAWSFRTRQLRRQRDELERKVAQRTQELTDERNNLEEAVAARAATLTETYRRLAEESAERLRAEQALDQVRHAAVTGRLAGSVAHQINTPLGSMKARIDLLKDEIDDPPAAMESLAVLGRQVDRIAKTTRALLGFVRDREVGDDNPRVAELLSGIVDLFGEVLRSHDIQLELRIPKDLPPVQGRIDDLQEAILNLVENAREALSPGRKVTITAEQRGATVALVIEDDGPGLGEHPERLFEPFVTTKTTGTGLGLAIARRIAEGAGGSLSGENRPVAEGGGARFILVLPVAATPRPAGPSHPETASS